MASRRRFPTARTKPAAMMPSMTPSMTTTRTATPRSPRPSWCGRAARGDGFALHALRLRIPLPARGEGVREISAYREALFDRGVADRLLQLLEGAHLDLAHALAADAVLLREVFQRGRLVLQPALLEDVALALVEVGHGRLQQRAALAQLLRLGEQRLLVLRLVDQPVLPFAVAIDAQDRKSTRLNSSH